MTEEMLDIENLKKNVGLRMWLKEQNTSCQLKVRLKRKS